jgi:hypothetical protein
VNKPHTSDIIKENVCREFAAIPADMLQCDFANLEHDGVLVHK